MQRVLQPYCERRERWSAYPARERGIGTVLRRIFRQHMPEGIGCRIGQFPERRIMGETERHIMAPFAQPLGLIDCLACTAAAVAGRGNDDYAHDVLSFGALCVK